MLMAYMADVAKQYGKNIRTPWKEHTNQAYKLWNGQVFWEVRANEFNVKCFVDVTRIARIKPFAAQGGCTLVMECGYRIPIGIKHDTAVSHLKVIFDYFELEGLGREIPDIDLKPDPYLLERRGGISQMDPKTAAAYCNFLEFHHSETDIKGLIKRSRQILADVRWKEDENPKVYCGNTGTSSVAGGAGTAVQNPEVSRLYARVEDLQNQLYYAREENKMMHEENRMKDQRLAMKEKELAYYKKKCSGIQDMDVECTGHSA